MTDNDRKLVDGLIEALAGPERGERPAVDTLTRNELERLLKRLQRQAYQDQAQRPIASEAE